MVELTTVSFEAASIIDVIKRAEKAAPKVSTETMRFCGILLDVQPAGNYVVVRTTNEKVFYREIVDPIGISGERVEWRLSSSYLSKAIATFRAGSGMTIEFTQNGGLVEVTQDRKKARMGIMRTDSYPAWYESEIAGAATVVDLGAAIKLVEWASDSTIPKLNGVHFTGEGAYATNRYIMARMPLEIAGLEAPITLEAGLINGLIEQRGDVKFKVVGGQALISPQEQIQIRTALIGEPFPPITRAMRTEYPASFRCPRDEIINLVKTGLSMHPDDKSKGALFRFFIGNGTVAAVMEQEDDPTTGIRDIIDVGGAEHDTHEIGFNPHFIAQAISNSPDEAIHMRYDPSDPKTPCLIESESGYQCWVVPIDPSKRRGNG